MNQPEKITETISPEEASAGLVADMPSINENAVNAAAESAVPSAPSLAPVVDKHNRPFDPKKFRSNPDGSPRLDITGRFIPLNNGRKSEKSSGDAFSAPETASYVAPDPTPPRADPINVTLETSIGVIQTALIMLGEEEGVLTETEKMLLRPPLERVLKKYNVGEMPAELDLAVALAGIIIIRLQKPKTQSRIERLKMWFGGKLADFRGARRAEKIREETSAVAS